MLKLRQRLPARLATNPTAKRVPFSPTDTPEALKENICATVGLHPALKPAVRITNTNPPVLLITAKGWPDLADTDSAIKALDIALVQTAPGRNTWSNNEHAPCDVVVDCLPDGTVTLLRSTRALNSPPQERDQAHCLVADRTVLAISFEPDKLPPSVFIVSGHVFTLEPHLTVGDLQACCADTFGVPVDNQALLVGCMRVDDQAPHHATYPARTMHAPCTHPAPLHAPHHAPRPAPPTLPRTPSPTTRAGRRARSSSCTSSCGPEAALSS